MAEHAHITPTPTAPAAGHGRRSLAGGALLALLGTAAASAAPGAPPHPDAALLRLGAELDAAWLHQEAAAKSMSDDEFEAMMDAGGVLVDRIEHLPARTLEGLLVKARAISWCNSGEEIDPDRFSPYPSATTDARLAASIVRDLLVRA